MLRILTYHRVCDLTSDADLDPHTVSATPADFARQVRHLAASYRVVSAEQALAALRGGPALPRRAVLLTFDDGYRDFGEIAWPILRRYGMSAVVFVPTAYPDAAAREFWWDRLARVLRLTRLTVLDLPAIGPLALDTVEARQLSFRRLRSYLKTIPHPQAMETVERACEKLVAADDAAPRASSVLGWADLRALADDGVTVAAHTQTHPALTHVAPDDARREIRGSREDLERELAVPAVPIFSYPFGLHDERVVQLVREEGFEAAVSCIDGQNSVPTMNPLRLRRTNITRRTSPFIFRLRLLTPVSALDRWRHRAAAHA